MDNLKALEKCDDLKVMVIGDLMLDSYWWGSVNRISPEAPVPILDVNKVEDRLGGAGNVALNTQNMGSKTYLYSVVGEDENGKRLKSLMEEQGLSTEGILELPDFITTTKTRVLSQNQQLVRIDKEKIDYIQETHAFIDFVLKGIQRLKPDVVILEDYNKGIFSEYVIRKIIEHAKLLDCFISVDPKNINFLTFEGVDLFKPNWKEVMEALKDDRKDDYSIDHLLEIDKELRSHLHHDFTLITLSEKGMFCASADDHYMVPSEALQVRDVSGAGDTVIAVSSLMMAITGDVEFSTKVANIAGGIVCGYQGVVPIDKQILAEQIQNI